jgi:transcriptional regulator with XRE-family HTH domain
MARSNVRWQLGGRSSAGTSVLLAELKDPKFRAQYFAAQLKRFLAEQIRALRGDLSQTEFGQRIGKPQSVISRLERQSHGNINLQTLIDIATKLDVGLIIQFVDLPAFLQWANEYRANVAPEPYNDGQIEDLLEEETGQSESRSRPPIQNPKLSHSYQEH